MDGPRQPDGSPLRRSLRLQQQQQRNNPNINNDDDASASMRTPSPPNPRANDNVNERTLRDILDSLTAIEADNNAKANQINTLNNENTRLTNELNTTRRGLATEIANAKINLESKIKDEIKENRQNWIGLSTEETDELLGNAFPSIYETANDNNGNVNTYLADIQKEAEISALHDPTDQHYNDQYQVEWRKTAAKMINNWDTKLESYEKAPEYLEKLDYYARTYMITRYQRFTRITTALMNKDMEKEFRAARKIQQIESYDEFKKWLFKSRDGLARIAVYETKIAEWKMKANHSLLKAFAEFMSIINAYVEEIKFAKLHGAKRCDIQETPEPWIFNCFLNGTTGTYRTDLWNIYLKKIHGIRAMGKAELMIKHVHATRPVNLKEAEAREEINAIFHQSGKYCPLHKSNSHSAEECREMKRGNKDNYARSENKNWRDRKFRSAWKSKYKTKFRNYYKKKFIKHVPGVNCEAVGHSKANCRALKNNKCYSNLISKQCICQERIM